MGGAGPLLTHLARLRTSYRKVRQVYTSKTREFIRLVTKFHYPRAVTDPRLGSQPR